MKIVILGSGNVATHVGIAIRNLGHEILQVYSRNQANAQALADVLDTSAIADLSDINKTADLYLLAVSDQAIVPLVNLLPKNINGIVVHCSGATDSNVLSEFQRYGVIYPPQSIKKNFDSRLQEIPFAVEGNIPSTANTLLTLMASISSKSFLCTSQQRLALHTAAVFANNFTNALFQISYDILQEQNLPFDLLKPIILETANKVQTNTPKDIQTGPAQRNDQLTIQKHLQFLSKKPNWLKIYQQLTEEIISKRDK